MEAIWKKVHNVKHALKQLETHHDLLQVTALSESSDNNRITYTHKGQITKVCLEEAHQQFTQVAAMPILQPLMATQLSHADLNSLAFQQITDSIFSAHQPATPQQNAYYSSWHNNSIVAIRDSLLTLHGHDDQCNSRKAQCHPSKTWRY